MGPIWRGGGFGERALLESCYRESLNLALEHGCESVAFPLISSGAYGYPKEQVLQIAVNEIGKFLLSHDMLVYIAVFDKASFKLSRRLVCDIEEYIDENYVDLNFEARSRALYAPMCASEALLPKDDFADSATSFCTPAESLGSALENLDESFSQMLLRKIDEKGLTDSQAYKKANVDRRLFSKIRSDANYKPSKPTAIAFAIALELSLEETNDFLMKAGFALSRSNKFDVIIEYFIKHGNYNIFEINEALFEFEQQLLGA